MRPLTGKLNLEGRRGQTRRGMDEYHSRAARIITAALALAIVACLLRGCGLLPVEAGPAHIGDCLPGLVAPVFGVRPLTDLDMAALRGVEAVGTFWQGYESNTPFAIPADNTSAGDVRGHTTGDLGGFYDAGVSVFVSADTPAIVYVLVYADLTPDAPGVVHEGTHPCAALVVDAEAWAAWATR